MFLMRDGTLVTLFRGDARDVCQPIVERLRVGWGWGVVRVGGGERASRVRGAAGCRGAAAPGFGTRTRTHVGAPDRPPGPRPRQGLGTLLSDSEDASFLLNVLADQVWGG